MVNKVDLIPAGLLLLTAHWSKLGRVSTLAWSLAFAIGLSWYLFAWFYFGAPLPNSFLTKALHQGGIHSSLDWTWFGHLVFMRGDHTWLLVFALMTLWQGIR